MNGDISRVLKAPTQPILDLASLQHRLPLYASDKEDGIRCIIHPRLGPVSQTMKPILNTCVRQYLNRNTLVGLDGELVATDLKGEDLGFNDTQSAIMTRDGSPRFQFRVFDWFENQYMPYDQRMVKARSLVGHNIGHIRWLPQYKLNTVKELEEYEADAIKRGKEGIMLRHPQGWYKEGRSTPNEAYLLKVKRFMDDEAVVIGVEEEMENCNPATRDAGGLQRRSKHAAQLKGKKMVGKLLCMWRDLPIKVAGGTHDQKREWWRFPSTIVGQTITFKYQAHGMKILPRCPVFKGIRHDV